MEKESIIENEGFPSHIKVEKEKYGNYAVQIAALKVKLEARGNSKEIQELLDKFMERSEQSR